MRRVGREGGKGYGNEMEEGKLAKRPMKWEGVGRSVKDVAHEYELSSWIGTCWRFKVR